MDFQKAFFSSLQNAPAGSLAERLRLVQEAEISYYMELCPVQDAFRFRARWIGLQIAHLLIDEKGELRRDSLAELLELLDQNLYCLGPNREGDSEIYRHVRNCLHFLTADPQVWVWVKKFSPPLVHKKAEELIRETLWPESMRSVQTPAIRKAVLAAWFTWLRQTTGSCFATAPAIWMQEKEPIRFLKDLYDLLSTGQMKRIVAGKEYGVPLCPDWGKSDLQKPIGVSLELLAYSPGLIAALESVDLLPKGNGALEKIAHLQRLLERVGTIQNMEQVLRSILLEAADLTEEDLQDEERLDQLQMTPLLAKQTAIYYQPPSLRAQKIADWKKKYALACSAFQNFAECALLRCWEYTVASLCDVKTDFARWNLYVALGMNPEQPGGVGAFLYDLVNGHLQLCNQELDLLHRQYQETVDLAHSAEATLRSGVSEWQKNQVQAELTQYSHLANLLVQSMDEARKRAEAVAGFFPSLLQQYDEKLQGYFQELFDPSLLGEEELIYEDSPAGFRLAYKHGRSSQWTPIHEGKEYIAYLREFFSVVEGDIERPLALTQELISEWTTSLVQFIQSPSFLESALQRSKAAGRQSPWSYLSGGTMETLLQAYCSRDRSFTESAVAPQSAENLLLFLESYRNEGSLLIHSPNHAFIFHPHLLPPGSIEEKLAENLRWVRKWTCTETKQEQIAHRISEKLPPNQAALFLHLCRQRSVAGSFAQFRLQLVDALTSIKETKIKTAISLIDSILYEQMPLLSIDEAKRGAAEVFNWLAARHSIRFSPLEIEGSLISSYELMQKIKFLLLKAGKSPLSSIDWEDEIVQAMRLLGLAYPHPFLFADTNWSNWFFGFVMNPATETLELWRLNRIASRGFPMREWIPAEGKAAWILLTRSAEYSFFSHF